MAGFAKPICLYQLRIFTQLLLGSRTITVVGTHPIPSNAGASAFQRLPTSSSPPPYFCTNLTHEISFPSHGIHASIAKMTCTSINLTNVTMTTADFGDRFTMLPLSPNLCLGEGLRGLKKFRNILSFPGKPVLHWKGQILGELVAPHHLES